MKKMGTSNKIMTRVQCTICGMDMDCPESMLGADRHVCAWCADLLAKGYKPEELKMSPDDIARHLPRCNELSMLMMDITFDSYWDTVLKYGMEQIDNKPLAKECYLRGATSMPGLLISAGMPPEFLDELAEGMGEGK
jgi:hypothetical protein